MIQTEIGEGKLERAGTGTNMINTLVPNIGKRLCRQYPYAPYANKLAKKQKKTEHNVRNIPTNIMDS